MSMCAHRRLRPACASVQSDVQAEGTPWVAKVPTFLQAENLDSDNDQTVLIMLVTGSNIHQSFLKDNFLFKSSYS